MTKRKVIKKSELWFNKCMWFSLEKYAFTFFKKINFYILFKFSVVFFYTSLLYITDSEPEPDLQVLVPRILSIFCAR